MHARTLIVCGVVLYSMAGTPAAAQCGCGLPWLGYFVGDSSVTALFSGTVADVRQSRFNGTVLDLGRSDDFLAVTFEVERVWKGDLAKRTLVYRPVPAIPEGSGRSGSPVSLHFETGKRYVVVAHHLTAVERAQVGAFQNPHALMVEMCGGGSRSFEMAAPKVFDDLGTGWAPR
jgi:hypothetical protein